jgi:hypothetical protein
MQDQDIKYNTDDVEVNKDSGFSEQELEEAKKDFDINKFNAVFEKEIENTNKKTKEEEEKRLKELNKVKEEKDIYNMSVGEILINLKDELFDIIYDIITLRIFTTYNKPNRFFYIGLALMLYAIIMYAVTKANNQ